MEIDVPIASWIHVYVACMTTNIMHVHLELVFCSVLTMVVLGDLEPYIEVIVFFF
jgi:hypothetical protein